MIYYDYTLFSLLFLFNYCLTFITREKGKEKSEKRKEKSEKSMCYNFLHLLFTFYFLLLLFTFYFLLLLFSFYLYLWFYIPFLSCFYRRYKQSQKFFTVFCYTFKLYITYKVGVV